MTFKEMMADIKATYPAAQEIQVTYGGSGDNFDDFYDVQETDNLAVIPGSFITKYGDLLDAAIEATGATFDNEGAEGTIFINLVSNKVWAEHYYRVEVLEKDGDYEVNLDEEEEELC